MVVEEAVVVVVVVAVAVAVVQLLVLKHLSSDDFLLVEMRLQLDL